MNKFQRHESVADSVPGDVMYADREALNLIFTSGIARIYQAALDNGRIVAEGPVAADFKTALGKLDMENNDGTYDALYWLFKVDPKTNTTIHGSSVVLRDLEANGKIRDDPDNLGFKLEQIQEAVDYVEARIANGGTPIYE